MTRIIEEKQTFFFDLTRGGQSATLEEVEDAALL
jgi:hypothetical protein